MATADLTVIALGRPDASASAYIAEIQDFVDMILNYRTPRVTAEAGLKALALAVAAEESHLQAKPMRVSTVAVAATL